MIGQWRKKRRAQTYAPFDVVIKKIDDSPSDCLRATRQPGSGSCTVQQPLQRVAAMCRSADGRTSMPALVLLPPSAMSG